MNENILLSICIPTYKRRNELTRLLESIAGQASPEIEVVVSDDEKNNIETEKLVRSFGGRGLATYYVVDEHGPGFDQNLICASMAANGKYIWWLGDDDEITPKSISIILGAIKTYPNLVFAWANFLAAGTPEQPLFKVDHLFHDGNEVLEVVANLLGFVSSSIMRRSCVISSIEDAKQFIGTGFSNLYMVLSVLSNPGPKLFLRGPLIICYLTPAGEHSYDGFSVFAVHFYNIVSGVGARFKKKSIRKMIAKNFANVWRGILVARGRGDTTGLGSYSAKTSTIFKYYWSYPGFWIALPFLMMPRSVLRYFYRFYKLFFSHRKLRIFDENKS